MRVFALSKMWKQLSTFGLPDLSSESSSSIGPPGDNDDDAEQEDGFVSSGGDGQLASLGSIEDSLPSKRELSNHFVGKSKSFANLSDIRSVKDLPKSENPFNKKRRILVLAKKWSRKSFYTWQNPNSMPLLALNEDGNDNKTSSSLSSSSSSSSHKIVSL